MAHVGRRANPEPGWGEARYCSMPPRDARLQQQRATAISLRCYPGVGLLSVLSSTQQRRRAGGGGGILCHAWGGLHCLTKILFCHEVLSFVEMRCTFEQQQQQQQNPLDSTMTKRSLATTSCIQDHLMKMSYPGMKGAFDVLGEIKFSPALAGEAVRTDGMVFRLLNYTLCMASYSGRKLLKGAFSTNPFNACL